LLRAAGRRVDVVVQEHIDTMDEKDNDALVRDDLEEFTKDELIQVELNFY
jgi:hypothetical protein